MYERIHPTWIERGDERTAARAYSEDDGEDEVNEPYTSLGHKKIRHIGH